MFSHAPTSSATFPQDVPVARRRTARARVLIIDSHPIVRAGLRQIIESEEDMLVCAEADTLTDARSAIRASGPDVVIADITLKRGDGMDLVRDVRAHHPQLPILVLSGCDEAIYAERLLSVGASGYMTKQASTAQILHSLRRVIGGGISVSEAVGDQMIRGMTSSVRRQAANPIDRLSNREVQVLHMIGRGMSTRETAASLNLSVKTIESHRQRIKNKLNLRTGIQLVQYAINWFAAVDGGAGAAA
jgi:DNA-binding NarL/FixJ family response regulator